MKKTMAYIFTFVLSLALLAGCKSNEPPTTTHTPTHSPTHSTEPTKPSDLPKDETSTKPDNEKGTVQPSGAVTPR